ncbi:20454_t:CDS:2 [Rhizophagus irregularis]|nr:20454_t:CDS:2 [Rhizophagus irregularis]
MQLNYVKFNQKSICAELYNGLQDAIISGDDASNVGQRIIVPSSFTDGMAIVRVFGKHDLFITITCNPKWPEITEALLPNQNAQDRPDLISCVFNMKLKSILNDILKKDIFGKVIAYLNTIEFQKRGLPHAHLLLILAQEYKPKTVDDYNAIISAEIPDKHSNPNTFNIVKKSMMHGPCSTLISNSPCMKDGKCSKRYPRNFQEHTTENMDGYPIYRQVKGIQLDNRWVVPYNPYLTTKYDCHINVEICSLITAIKYLFKYVYKGHDHATVEISGGGNTNQINNNEISLYLDARYISASEATWRIFHYRLHNEKPDIIQLSVHLPGQHRVLFQGNERLEDILTRSAEEKTILTAWFHANTKYPHARRLTYAEFPSQWVYNKKTKEWKPRQRGNSIGHIYFIHPVAGEKYYLRMLLNVVRDSTSFENIRTVNGIFYHTFKEACIALNLLQDNEEWNQYLQEASQVQGGAQLRKLFATILLFCEPTRPKILWEKHIFALSDDILH